MTLLDLAKQLASCQNYVNNLGMQNTSSNPEEKIRADARMMLARSALEMAHEEYKQALRGLTAEELRAAIGGVYNDL